MLKAIHTKGVVEAGCDEAGRECLSGPMPHHRMSFTLLPLGEQLSLF